MIEIVDVRDLTDKERRKYELQQEIEQKQRELDELDTQSESNDTSKDLEETEKIYDYDPSIGDVTCDYGVIELVEPDSIGDIDTNDSLSGLCVYGPPESFGGND